MTTSAMILLLAIACLVEALRARYAEARLRRDIDIHTRTFELSHKLAEMQNREIVRIEEHIGLSRVKTPKMGPYR